MRTLRLYRRLLGAHFRSLLEYEADFLILAAATVLMQVINIVFLSALFAKVPVLNGWTFWSVVTMFGAVALAEGVGSLFFDGIWSLAWQINRGELDYYLVRPYPVALQSSSAETYEWTGSGAGAGGARGADSSAVFPQPTRSQPAAEHPTGPQARELTARGAAIGSGTSSGVQVIPPSVVS